MISPSLKFNLFNSSKVDLAPTGKAQSAMPSLGKVESSRVRFGIQEGMFSNAGESIPIIRALAGIPYLQAKSNGKDLVVLGDAAGEPLVSMERIGDKFFIFSAQGQAPVAQVTRSDKVLHVTYEGESEPTYTIHKAVIHPSSHFPTRHIIKHQGKAVASTRYGHGHSYVLTVNAGADSCLMICLAAIADEIHC